MQRLRHHFSSHVGIKLRRCSSTCIPPITLVRAGSVFCLGTAAGVFGSLVGMGGAFVVLPVLSGPLALPVHKAIGTSMGAVLGTCIGGVISFSTKELPLENKIETHHLDTIFGSVPLVSGDVNILASGFIILSAAMFAVIGARCSKHMHDRTIKLAQGIFMMCVAPSIMVRDYLKDNANSTTRDMHDDPSFEKTLGVNNIVTPYYVGRLLSIGVGAGFLAGFFGVGGGAVTVPCLVMLMDFDYKSALGTSMAVMVPTAVTGSITHLLQGTILIPYVLPLGIGCALGAYTGAKFSRYVDEEFLKRLFFVTMLVLGARTFKKAL